MIKQILGVLIVMCICNSAGAQTKTSTPTKTSSQTKPADQSKATLVLQINAGSRAPYGSVQDFTMDSKGKCVYFQGEVNGSLTDSAFFTITKAEVDSFLNKAEQAGFFNLDEDYHTGVDGSGIYIAMNSSGKKRGVNVVNIDVPQVVQIIGALNAILLPHKIQINYGPKSPTQK